MQHLSTTGVQDASGGAIFITYSTVALLFSTISDCSVSSLQYAEGGAITIESRASAQNY